MKCKSLKQTTLWTELSDDFRAPRNATLSHDRLSAWTFWKLHTLCTNRLRQNKRIIQAVLLRKVTISPNCKRELYFMIPLSIFCIRGLLVVIRKHAGEEHLPNSFCLDYGEDYIWSPLQHHSHTFSSTSKPEVLQQKYLHNYWELQHIYNAKALTISGPIITFLKFQINIRKKRNSSLKEPRETN